MVVKRTNPPFNGWLEVFCLQRGAAAVCPLLSVRYKRETEGMVGCPTAYFPWRIIYHPQLSQNATLDSDVMAIIALRRGRQPPQPVRLGSPNPVGFKSYYTPQDGWRLPAPT